MLKIRKRDIGRRGEQIAESFLTKLGYCVIEKNYYCRYGEIDIIAKNYQRTIFVEVKLRNVKGNRYPEPPELAINLSKINKIKKTAQNYILEKKLSLEKEYRFDVISIIIQNNKALIKHLKYAF